MEQVITNPTTLELIMQSGFAGIAVILACCGLVIAVIIYRSMALAKTYVERSAKASKHQTKIAAYQAKSLRHIGVSLAKLEYATRQAAIAQERLLRQQSRKLDTINEELIFVGNAIKGRANGNGYDHDFGGKQ